MEEMSVEMVERLDAVVGALELMVEKMAGVSAAGVSASGLEAEGVGRIVATVASEREAELEGKLAEAEARIAVLSAAGAGGRKTGIAGRMLAKAGEGFDAGAIDAALVSLTVEQRIAVKSELMRAGLV